MFAEIVQKREKQMPSTSSLPGKLESEKKSSDALQQPVSQSNFSAQKHEDCVNPDLPQNVPNVTLLSYCLKIVRKFFRSCVFNWFKKKKLRI